jgi:hypothetical protein
MASNAFTGRTMSISTDPKNRGGCWFAFGPGAIGETGPASSSSCIGFVFGWGTGAAGASCADATSGPAGRLPASARSGPFARGALYICQSFVEPRCIREFRIEPGERRGSQSSAPLGRAASSDRHRSRTIQRSLPPANAAGRPATALRAGTASLIIPSPLAPALS